MKKFYKSMSLFTEKDGDNFEGCLDQISDSNKCVEWRIRKSDKKLCIIQFYENGAGYTIFQSI